MKSFDQVDEGPRNPGARASRDPMAWVRRPDLRPEARRVAATPMPPEIAARVRAGERIVFGGVIHNATEAECFPWRGDA